MLRFFFSSRKRHSGYWRDWSSDVCSSDLCQTVDPGEIAVVEGHAEEGEAGHEHSRDGTGLEGHIEASSEGLGGGLGRANIRIGRASCRERVKYSVVAVSLKKKRSTCLCPQ